MNFPIPILLIVLAGSPPTGAAEPGSVLRELETRYAEDRAVALRLVLARYADELEALQKKLLDAADASGAARVQLERDRILPALGLPATAAENADEFAAFEEPAPATALPLTAPASTSGDLDATLKTLLPPASATAAVPAPGSAKSPPGFPGPVGRGRRVLRMANAQLRGSYDPVYGYVYWSPGRSASWTLSDLPAGSYKLQLRYASDDKEGGGKLTVKFGSTKIEADVPPTGSWIRKRDLVIGPFEIKDSRADLILTPSSVRPGASYLMDLAGVIVLPADSATAP